MCFVLQPRAKEDATDNQHEAAMFGDVTSLATIPKKIVYKDTDSILAPIVSVSLVVYIGMLYFVLELSVTFN